MKTVVIYGPTATGKTDLAIELAKKYNGELISADSRQVYKKLDIGTGKVSPNSVFQRANGNWRVDGVKIHGFDLTDPNQRFSVADFLKAANSSIIQIIKLKKIPIIVGGTGFYIKALISGIGSIGIPANQKLRGKLEKLQTGELYSRLYKLNRQKAISLNESDRLNPRRIIRAIEITAYGKGVEIKYKQLPVKNYIFIGLTAQNNILYKRADNWLRKRIKLGLFKEVDDLLSLNVSPDWLISLGLEYRWITKIALGEISKEHGLARLRGDIHSFIRRQKTFFGQFPKIEMFNIIKKGWREKLENKLDADILKKNA